MPTATRSLRIAVVGGGPVGLAFAARAAAACGERVDIDVIDALPRARPDDDSVDTRVYALSRASQDMLERLDLWTRGVADRASPYRRMCVWQGTAFAQSAQLWFDAAEVGEPDLGHIVEDRVLRAVLADCLERSPNAAVAVDARVGRVTRNAAGVTLELDSGRRIVADLLVAADGVGSPVRTALGMPVVEHDYGQCAIVAHVETAEPHAETAWQRFLPGGPLAFLPLGDGRSSIVWSVPAARAAALADADDASFRSDLQAASGGMLGAIAAVSPRASFPLQRLHALRYSEPRVALIGDAAHGVHPLAGQGMNLGFADAACLADVLAAALAAGDEVTDLRVLRRYDRGRKARNLEMMLALDAINGLFRAPAVAAPLRAFALGAAQRTPLLKRAMIRRALGLPGRGPAAAAGQPGSKSLPRRV